METAAKKTRNRPPGCTPLVRAATRLTGLRQHHPEDSEIVREAKRTWIEEMIRSRVATVEAIAGFITPEQRARIESVIRDATS